MDDLNQWINISENLPQENQKCICLVFKNKECEISIANFKECDFIDYKNNKIYINYWSPISFSSDKYIIDFSQLINLGIYFFDTFEGRSSKEHFTDIVIKIFDAIFEYEIYSECEKQDFGKGNK